MNRGTISRQTWSHRSIKGFTLIEMMVSVGIFAVIAGIVFPAMIEFLSVRERLEEKHSQLIGMQKTFLFLAKDLRFASNRLSKDEYGEKGKATLSVNDDHLIEFTAQYPDLNLGGLNVPRRVRWQLNDGVLQRIQYPVMDPDSDTRTLKQDLLTGVDDVEIELSVVEDGRDNTGKKWGEETRLPDMISVRVIMQNDVEYHRMFTMLAGDSLKALAASSAASAKQ
ncbi:MAG: general secretion pathway protein J [Cryomorphaceae bacterium]|jgi:general secretion pathway protein J